MSVILALDNSVDKFSVAIRMGDQIVARHCTEQPQTSIALPLITTLLDEHHLTLSRCDAFAFNAGPGKFSAMRLVCAIASTFSYINSKPLIRVPAFAVLAEAHYGDTETLVKCAIPAHREHVYFAVCKKESGLWQQSMVSLIAANSSPPPARRIRHACGEGFSRYPSLLGEARLSQIAVPITATTTAHLAVSLWQAGETVDPLHCEPLYVRQKIALTTKERQRLASQSNQTHAS